jgi:hypothetical protein
LNPLALKRVKSSVNSRRLDTLPLLKTGGSFPMVRSSSRHDICQLWTKITLKNKMIGDQSRSLKSGDRVCWGAKATDFGTVIATSWSEVTISWDDGETNSVSHNDMGKVERAPANSA